MSDLAIRVSGISKRYRLGQGGAAGHLRELIYDKIGGAARWLVGRRDEARETPDFWAVRDVSFDVDRGEVVGIIGRNGAGKSTLLKILSRITDPTTGRAEIYGRVGSLLEVGTGFHPELTGRENIFLNGTILGMSRAEIRRKFDEIVAFSEVEKFLDTPVKRYSSGMYVRLAFSVAAHLDPEVLIVDEVLAVGDTAFQSKCLGKMQDVAHSGRTVLFVSHNMDAVMSLCSKVVVMEAGRNTPLLSTEEGIKRYLKPVDSPAAGAVRDLPRRTFGPKRPTIITDLVIDSQSGEGNVFPTGDRVTLTVGLENLELSPRVTCAVALLNERCQRVAFFHTEYHSKLDIPGAPKVRLRCDIPALALTPGEYMIEITVAEGKNLLERVEEAGRLHVHFADLLGTGLLPSYRQGNVVIPADWTRVEAATPAAGQNFQEAFQVRSGS